LRTREKKKEKKGKKGKTIWLGKLHVLLLLQEHLLLIEVILSQLIIKQLS